MSFSNCMWFSVISFFTVGYGDIYPMTYPGRMVNTIIIIGGMISSAIVIGLVHDAMELTNEEEHVFRFIKTRRKEQRRKNVALGLIVQLFRMNVIKQKELNKGNIKWRNMLAVKNIINGIYNLIDEWKKLNGELDVGRRRENEMQNELASVKHIEEKLTGLVSNGLIVWDFLKTN